VLVEIVIKDGVDSPFVGQAILLLLIQIMIIVIANERQSRRHFKWSENINLGEVVLFYRRNEFLAVGRESFQKVPAELSLLDPFSDDCNELIN
jgi:hypothetical protein